MKTTPKLLLLLLITGIHLNMVGQEICNNGIDDDGDNLIDLNDMVDCACDSTINSEVVSLIPNPSFEEHWCVPMDFSSLDCATGWVQATDATSDYYIVEENGFYLSNTPLPLPDGNGIVGFIVSSSSFGGPPVIYYEEYVGACLLAPLEAGVEYTIQMYLAGSSIDGSGIDLNQGAYYGPLDITIFGSASCPTWPVLSFNACPVGFDDWTELGSVSYQADETWQQISITFVPTFDVESVMIGGPCTLTDDFNLDDFNMAYPYFWVDNLTLNTSASFSNQAITSGSLCTDDLVLHGNADSLLTEFQWYYNGIALPGQTDSLLLLSELGLSTGTYQFMSSSSDGFCSIYEMEVNPPDSVDIEISAVNNVGCYPLTVSFENLTDTDNCFWNFGDGTTSSDCQPTHTYTESGTYSVTYTITTTEGCEYSAVYNNLVTVLEPPVSNFSLSPDVGCSPMEVILTNNSQFADTYLWNLGDGAVFTTADNDPFAHQYLAENLSDTYTVQLIAKRDPNCADTSSISLVTNVCGCNNPDAINYNVLAGVDDGSCIFPQASIFVPNVFTPNGDSENQRFELKTQYLKYLRLVIYDRWGNEVFNKESNSPDSNNPGWDGTYGGTDASEGVYYFLYEASDTQQKKYEGEGYFHLLRNN